MKYLKTYENKKTFREINFNTLWDDFTKYGKELLPAGTLIGNTEKYFENNVVKPLLQNKEIEFGKINPISGKVRNAIIDLYQILIDLDEHDGDTGENWYMIGDITRNRKYIVKIYDCEITEIENNIDLIKNAAKYNI